MERLDAGGSEDSADDALSPEALRLALADARQQMAAMASAQEEFVRALSHDLRAPLRHITSYGALVREVLGDLPEAVRALPELVEAHEFLGTMDQSGRRMGLMIDGLNLLVQAQRTPLRRQPVPLSKALALAREALAPAEAALAQAGRAVQWQVAADLPVLDADPQQLQQVLVQLLGNALKFSRGSTPPSIAVEVGAAPGQFSLADNGTGFDPARASGLFGVFQRLHRDSEFEGVGVGLAVSRTLAERHGARIDITAQPGAGCTVRVDWPVAGAA